MICSLSNAQELVPESGQYAFATITCDQGFTPGELVISLFVFWILAGLVISFTFGRIFGIKIRQ
jgi:hypothetical protein